MRIRSAVFSLLMATILVGAAYAQAPAAAPKPAAAAKPTAGGAYVNANLAQLMKGIFYPNSNVIFAAQDVNPNDVKPAKDPSTAPNPLESAYGKWEAVENAGLALADAANLLTLPGRKCSNGLPTPLRNADWPKLVAGLRTAGLQVYAAAKAKDQDKILEVAETMTTACSNCHDKYREKPAPAQRCK